MQHKNFGTSIFPDIDEGESSVGTDAPLTMPLITIPDNPNTVFMFDKKMGRWGYAPVTKGLEVQQNSQGEEKISQPRRP